MIFLPRKNVMGNLGTSLHQYSAAQHPNFFFLQSFIKISKREAIKLFKDDDTIYLGYGRSGRRYHHHHHHLCSAFVNDSVTFQKGSFESARKQQTLVF